eukprot:TRINITY_DN3668_c0_g1_i1.p1 TRINITY_DN3668_c0_g1~~TRINITY_DN3668_c0_g1_i1.p1  ORF type:complete len:715 (-),score=265.40 TRINITY_DN3668_c0_g1_i1:48-2129(-)
MSATPQPPRVHIVVPGDTLAGIALHYHTTVGDLMELNPSLSATTFLFSDQRVILPSQERTTTVPQFNHRRSLDLTPSQQTVFDPVAPSTNPYLSQPTILSPRGAGESSTESSSSSDPLPGLIDYICSDTDNLSSIALRFGLNVEVLRKINGNTRRVAPGQCIKLPEKVKEAVKQDVERRLLAQSPARISQGGSANGSESNFSAFKHSRRSLEIPRVPVTPPVHLEAPAHDRYSSVVTTNLSFNPKDVVSSYPPSSSSSFLSASAPPGLPPSSSSALPPDPSDHAYSSGNGVLHEVKEGETLASIADLYQVPIKLLERENFMTTVKRGQKIIIPETDFATFSIESFENAQTDPDHVQVSEKVIHLGVTTAIDPENAFSSAYGMLSLTSVRLEFTPSDASASAGFRPFRIFLGDLVETLNLSFSEVDNPDKELLVANVARPESQRFLRLRTAVQDYIFTVHPNRMEHFYCQLLFNICHQQNETMESQKIHSKAENKHAESIYTTSSKGKDDPTSPAYQTFPVKLLNTSKFLLPASHPLQLVHNQLPRSDQLKAWKLRYSTEEHGLCYLTFMNCVSQLQRTLLFVRTTRGNIIGAYFRDKWLFIDKFHGTGETFIFSLHPNLAIYDWKKENKLFLRASHSGFTFGGGSEGLPGLWIDNEFNEGTSYACETFGNQPLCGASTSFKVLFLEVWMLVEQ